jgi:signal transduction histidine kinase
MLATSRLGSGSFAALARFGLLALVPVLALGAVLAHELNVDVQQRYLDTARTSASLIARVGIQPLLDEQMISNGMSASDIQTVDLRLQGAAVSDDVRRIKVWNRAGTVVYSDNPVLIGKTFPIDDDLENALAGTSSASVTSGNDPENAGDDLTGDLIQVYVPLVFQGSSSPAGAFEIYLPYAPVQAAVDQESRQLYGVLAIGLTLFYAAMFPVVLIAERWRRRLRNQAEAAALANLAVLERLNRVKTEFIARISHQFRTALVGIQGFSELIRDSDPLDMSEVKAFASDIYKDAERLSQAFDEMLELDRPETARLVLQVSQVNFNRMVDEVVDAVRRDHPDRRFVVDLDPAVTVVSCDPEKISQVLSIMLANAIKYSPRGTEVGVVGEAGDRFLTLTVKDHGSGMPSDFDAELFMRDGQGDGHARQGLGLPIARQIIEMHGGRIWFDSTAGKGSEFHFTLPLHITRSRELTAITGPI